MKIAVLKETRSDETRVAASPDTVKKYVAMGAVVAVETGAGDGARFSDEAYRAAGAEIAKSAADAANAADLVLKVQRPTKAELSVMQPGAALAAILQPYAESDLLKAYASAKIDALAMDLMPRITRAQSMDVLSSQSNLAGYKAVIDAAAYYGRAFPMIHHGRRRRRPAGDRDRPPPRRRCFRNRCPPRRQGASAEPRGDLCHR